MSSVQMKKTYSLKSLRNLKKIKINDKNKTHSITRRPAALTIKRVLRVEDSCSLRLSGALPTWSL